jgi:2-amino-4-hydroxy-6-hydroxymethyldihydropteridine diphosphokinase
MPFAQVWIHRMIVIALGANLDSQVGPPAKTITAAWKALSIRGIQIASASRLYRTPAWPDPSDPPFVNAVACIETKLSPRALMDVLHDVETSFGRERTAKNAPRTLDLDLIDYQGRVEDGPPVLPHPRMAERAFVLIPMADVAPEWRHPQSGASLADLMAALGDRDYAAVMALPD